ncbi:MAG: PadR family transcriptional regulator, partial [Chloroflexota bacterium]
GLLEAQSCHGYQLLDHFRDTARLGTIWNLSTSQLYTILKRLERAEAIDGREEASEDAPIRTVYWLTDAGRERLHGWLNDPAPSASTRAIRTEFLSRLYLCRLLNLPTQHIIQAQRDACLAHRDDLVAERDALKQGAGYLSLDLRVREMDEIMVWLGEAESIFARVSA